MKYMKKFEDYYTWNKKLEDIKQKFKEIGWKYQYFEQEDSIESFDDFPYVIIQNDVYNINIFYDKVSIDCSRYLNKKYQVFSFDFEKPNFSIHDMLTDFEKIIKIVNDLVKFSELYEKADILDDNDIIDLEFPYVEIIELWNNDISEIIEEHDYLFNATDMGLL